MVRRQLLRLSLEGWMGALSWATRVDPESGADEDEAHAENEPDTGKRWWVRVKVIRMPAHLLNGPFLSVHG